MNQLSDAEQRAVLQLLADGYSSHAIHRIMGVHTGTIQRLHQRTIQRQDGERRLGRPPLGEKGRSTTVLVRVTEDHYAKMIKQAKSEGCKNLSTWIRRTLNLEAKRILAEKANNKESIPLQM